MQAKGSKASQICSNENRRPAAGRKGNWAKRPMLDSDPGSSLAAECGKQDAKRSPNRVWRGGGPSKLWANHGLYQSGVWPPKMYGAAVLVSGLGGSPFSLGLV